VVAQSSAAPAAATTAPFASVLSECWWTLTTSSVEAGFRFSKVSPESHDCHTPST
jgi:hypothetical protein